MKQSGGLLSLLLMIGSVIGLFLLGYLDQHIIWALAIIASYAFLVVTQGKPQSSKEVVKSAGFALFSTGVLGGAVYFAGRILS